MEATVILPRWRQITIAITLICFGIGLRLLPHPANFAPITAIAIFGGAVLPRRLGIWVPLTAMVMSDLVIGLYDMVWVTWGCYLLIAFASGYWLRKPTLMRGIVFTLSSSLFFFIVTNFAVWLSSGMYSHTLVGFAQCYTMAIPFFRNTVLSDALYAVALFGIYALACNGVTRLSVSGVQNT